MFNLLPFVEILGIFLCSVIIYASGIFMNYISDKHKDKEWINSIVACVDIFLIAVSLVFIIKLLYISFPYLLAFTAGIIILGVLILFITFIIDKTEKLIRKH